MRTFAAVALGLGLLGAGVAPGDDKKDEKKPAGKYDGKYTLVAGKRNDKPIDEDAKKAEYTFTDDRITIKGKGLSFVMGYKVDPKTDPAEIDMVILDGPEQARGARAAGIIELKGDALKLAYAMEKDKDDKLRRAKTFDGKEGLYFEFKRAK